MRAHLDERIVPIGHQFAQGVEEAHRLAEVPDPVRRVERVAVTHTGGDSRVDGYGGRSRAYLGEIVEQLPPQRVDLRTVRCNVDLHRPAENVSRRQRGNHLFQGGRIPGDHR